MSREIDRRDFSVNKVTPDREAQLNTIASDISARLPGPHRLQIAAFDTITGNPRTIVSEFGPGQKGNYIQRALEHMQSISPVLGLAATQPVEFVADPNIQQTSSGAVTVHLQQTYKGIPIFQAAQTVRFVPDGTLKDTVGSSVTIAQEVAVSPKLSIEEALLKAAQHVAVPDADEQGFIDSFGQPLNLLSVNMTNFVPKIIATFLDKSDQPTVLDSGPFAEKIKGGLLWFPLGNDLRLSWDFIITMPNYEGQYQTIVDADSGEILYCLQLVQTAIARGNVFRVDGNGTRQMTDFPRALTDYGLPIPDDLPAVFPDDWVMVDRTVGNSTVASQGNSGPAFQGVVQNGILTFNPANAVGVDQEVLNTFYYCCFMHDFFYLLGFRESDGNFQLNNFGRGGFFAKQGDLVRTRVHPGVVFGTANMFSAPIDGGQPVMNLGLVAGTNRHTALDSTVVFHEFMHSVTNRLVGGAQHLRPLVAPQSRSMGEGWGDYIACTINSVVIVGNWVLNNTGGFRNFPYDSSFPDNFGNLGTGRYTMTGEGGRVAVHNIGEIWCATLMEMNRNIGATLGVQLVVDALKLSPSNPSFLDMRDAILEALHNKHLVDQLTFSQHAAFRHGIWLAFAKFGMGIHAKSNGASLTGIVADFTVETNNVSIPVTLQLGVYTIQQGSNGRLVDAHEIEEKDFALVTRLSQNNDTQKWIFTPAGGIYTIQQGSNGRFVDAHELAGKDFGLVTRLQQNNDTQKWILTHLGNDIYTIQQLSNGRFVDAHVPEANKDFAVVTREAQNDDSQRWFLKPSGPRFTLQQKSSGRFMDAHEIEEKDFALVTRPEQNDLTQRWIIRSL